MDVDKWKDAKTAIKHQWKHRRENVYSIHLLITESLQGLVGHYTFERQNALVSSKTWQNQPLEGPAHHLGAEAIGSEACARDECKEAPHEIREIQ